MPDATTFDPTNPLASVQAMMKGELDPARETHASALQALKSAHMGELPVEATDDAGRWGAIASGLASAGPGTNFGEALARAGGAYGRELSRQFDIARQNRVKAADLEFQDAAKRLQGLEAKYMGALAGQTSPSSMMNQWQVVKLADGQWARVNKLSGQSIPLATNDVGQYQKAKDQGLKVALELGHPNPLQYAEEYASSVIANKPAGTETQVFQPVGAVAPQQRKEELYAIAPGDNRASIAKQLEDEEKRAVQAGDYAKATELQKMRLAIPTAPVDKTAIPQRPTIEDRRQDVKEAEAFGAEYGKGQAKKAESISSMGSAARNLLGNLNVMERLYTQHGNDIPEGELGPYIASFKSGLTSLGVPLEGTGATDIIKALGTEQALKARTAGGENLLPGAMSNYEDKLLQSMSPSLGMTAEGRMLMIQLAKAQMNMKAELADAAHEYIIKHKRLDSGWERVATEIAKKNPYLNERRLKAIETMAKRLTGGSQ